MRYSERSSREFKLESGVEFESMIDLSLLLPKLLNATESNPEMAETVAKLAWTRAAGEGLRNHAVPFRLYRRMLIVSVADAIWQKQLRHMSPEFIFRINKLLGRSVVEDIEFRIDPVAVDRMLARIPAPQTSREETRAPIPELLSAVGSITDPDLRDRFMRAAENCIERRESRMQAR
jgi:hypothetical protein